MKNFIKIAILCGGPSPERGIALNSARSVLDHLGCENVELTPVYIDIHRRAYKISKYQLYSNTPSDFDFKLRDVATPLTEKQLVRLLKQADLTFPIMHGAYGEDGTIQRFLERHKVPFIGSSAAACKLAFDKFTANEHLKTNGFHTLPSILLQAHKDDHETLIETFFKTYGIERAVVKPASGGSSIGVKSVHTPLEALEHARFLFSKRSDTRVVVEAFAEGHEFTVIVLENRFGMPVALPPTEIETDYTQNQIFDFRRKYLPTRQVTWHNPPRFSDENIDRIQVQAEQIFKLFGMRDFARFDGWLLPSGKIWFCDLNPISGMEQNSFLFQQGVRVGLTHEGTLKYIVNRACQRYQIERHLPETTYDASDKKIIAVLTGGMTSERQVALMSGTNVWLKLRQSKQYKSELFLLHAAEHTNKPEVWHVPYHLALNHTVEEVFENCVQYASTHTRMQSFEQRSRLRLGLTEPIDATIFHQPKRLSLEAFAQQNPNIFLGLHGGIGEDGTLQSLLEHFDARYNGSDAKISRLCMDKFATAEAVQKLHFEGIGSLPHVLIKNHELHKITCEQWCNICEQVDSKVLIVKPSGDGCSTGIVKLQSYDDLKKYATCVYKGLRQIPADTFEGQSTPVEMPQTTPDAYLLEAFVKTDKLCVRGNKLHHLRVNGWVEVTVGVLEQNGVLSAMHPSITIAEGNVLSVEEKFQGGTGVNLTPPPTSIVSSKALKHIRQRIEKVARAIGIRGYARIDAFVHGKSGEVKVIEINTLPGLTPSTVFYHQGLAEPTPLTPTALLEKIVASFVD